MGPHKCEQIRKGDHVTFLPPDESTSYYIAESDADAEGTFDARFVCESGYVDDFVVREGDPSGECQILNRDPNKENNTVTPNHEANQAKLEVAADYGLQAKFTYTNECGEAAERRVRPTQVWANYADNVIVSGMSYDANGSDEGHRNFRLDRIEDDVVIR